MSKKLYQQKSQKSYGHQKLSSRQIQNVVSRLYDTNCTKRKEKALEEQDKERMSKIRQRPMTAKDVSNMVTRLTHNSSQKAPDANRTGACSRQGICNTYAWKGST